MISEQYATAQVMRMQQLDYFPRDSTGVGELTMAASQADTEFTCWNVINDFMENYRECPKPVDIRRAIHRLKAPVKRADCGACGGSGFIVVAKKYDGKREDLRQMYGNREIDFSEKCGACQ